MVVIGYYVYGCCCHGRPSLLPLFVSFFSFQFLSSTLKQYSNTADNSLWYWQRIHAFNATWSSMYLFLFCIIPTFLPSFSSSSCLSPHLSWAEVNIAKLNAFRAIAHRHIVINPLPLLRDVRLFERAFPQGLLTSCLSCLRLVDLVFM